MENKIYKEACPKCLGVGYMISRDSFASNAEKIKKTCAKCKGEKVFNYRISPKRRKYSRQYYSAHRGTAPVRWTPPEKTPVEYDYEYD